MGKTPLKLICITIMSVTLLLTLVIFRITTLRTTVREIHHYSMHDAAVENVARELLCEHMREILNEQLEWILYGCKRDEQVLLGRIWFWWELSPYNLFGIFPDGTTNYYYGNQGP